MGKICVPYLMYIFYFCCFLEVLYSHMREVCISKFPKSPLPGICFNTVFLHNPLSLFLVAVKFVRDSPVSVVGIKNMSQFYFCFIYSISYILFLTIIET